MTEAMLAGGVALVVADEPERPLADAFEASCEAVGVLVARSDPDKAAGNLQRLLAQPDARVVVVGVASAAEAAVRAALDDGVVVALVLVDAELVDDTRELLGEWDELPVLALADPSNRATLASATDVRLSSRHACSDLRVGAITGEVLDGAARWLADRLATVVTADEIVVVADDGWELHGTRWLPRRDGAAPGVVLLHSGRSDRAVFSRLERLLAEHGFAVLNLDWRGRGMSTGRGTYFDLTADERAEGWRDAAAALDHLAGLPGVDAERLAAVGVIHGAEHAARAAQRDRRVKALVLLTGYRPADDAEGAHLTSGAVDVLYVTSADHRITTAAMRSLYDASPSPATRYVEYPGGAIGYQLFEVDHQLEPRIVSWLDEVLGQ